MENKNLNNPQAANSDLGAVSERYFDLQFVNNGEYHKDTIKANSYFEAVGKLSKKLTGLFNVFDYEEYNVR